MADLYTAIRPAVEAGVARAATSQARAERAAAGSDKTIALTLMGLPNVVGTCRLPPHKELLHLPTAVVLSCVLGSSVGSQVVQSSNALSLDESTRSFPILHTTPGSSVMRWTAALFADRIGTQLGSRCASDPSDDDCSGQLTSQRDAA